MASNSSSQQQQQQQQQHRQQLFQQLQQEYAPQQPQKENALEEEYLSAKRAAVEAVSIGRDTLEVAEQQGEQLERTERAADDTKYMLDKANRKLRGMTWSGWVANMFTKDPTTASASATALASRIVPKVYDHVPLPARSAAQAVQNYHANVSVLLETVTAALSSSQNDYQQSATSSQEQQQQLETCQVICDNMFQVAWLEVSQLQQGCSVDVVPFCQCLALDLAALRDRQKKASEKSTKTSKSSSKTSPRETQSPQQNEVHIMKNRDELLKSSSTARNTSTAAAVVPAHPHWQVQEEHLDFMSGHLDELRNIAHSLGGMMDLHTERLESLHETADDNLEASKLVTRRADRLIQAKAWSKPRAAFHSFVSIRHLGSGHYMAVNPASPGTLVLSAHCHPETCVFAVWTRGKQHSNKDADSTGINKGNNSVLGLFGLQHQATKKWVGQSFLLGTLSCTATSFGQREEWEADDNWTNSTLLCASAGWGHGAYLEVASNGIIYIGSSTGTASARAQAARWNLTELATARQS